MQRVIFHQMVVSIERSTSLCTVIVPVFKEEKILPLFHSRLIQTLGRTSLNWDVIYVDGGSTENTFILLTQFQAHPSINMVLILLDIHVAMPKNCI